MKLKNTEKKRADETVKTLSNINPSPDFRHKMMLQMADKQDRV